MSRLEISFVDDGLAVGSYADVFLTVLREPASKMRLGEIRRAVEPHARAHAGRTRSITVLERGAAAAGISDETRKESNALITDFPSLASAIVIEGEGFGVAMLRTFAAGLNLVQRTSSPSKVVSNVPDAAR